MKGRLVHSEELTRYDFGSDHPMGPGRVRNTISLARHLGVLDRLDVVEPSAIDLVLLHTVHTPDYIAAVQAGLPDPAYGLGTTDNPIFPAMHDITATVVMATVDAARSVWEGEALRASNISGGLHHAMPSATSGFCVYNDIAVAIRWLLDHGCERVGYVDVDVHHGDGVQTIFYDDPRVMTVSLHETPTMLFPGTGFPHETGGPGAEGTAVNIALPPGHRRCRVAAGLRRGGAGGAPRVSALGAGDPARLRLTPPRPARRPRVECRRAARLLPDAGRTG